MLKSKRNALMGAALAGVFFAGNAYAETTLNALFMAQAAYSEADVRAMTDAFAKANPDVKVNLEFVPYEGLHDKTVLAQGSGGGYDVVLFDVIWPAEYASNKVLVDVSSRVTDDMKKNVLPGAWTTVQYDGAYYGMPWILDTKIPVLQQGHPGKGRHQDAAEDLGRACRTGQDHQGQGPSGHPDRLELVAGGSRDLRLHHAGQRLWRRFPEGWQAGFPDRWRP